MSLDELAGEALLGLDLMASQALMDHDLRRAPGRFDRFVAGVRASSEFGTPDCTCT